MLLNSVISISNNKQSISTVNISDILGAMYFQQTIPGYTKTFEKHHSAEGNITYEKIEYTNFVYSSPYIGTESLYQYFYTVTSDDIATIDNGNVIIATRFAAECFDSTILYKDVSHYKFYSTRIMPYYIYRKYGTVTVGDKIPVGSQGDFFIQRCV